MEIREIIFGLALPLVLLVFGLFTRIGLPRRVNWFVGYRTPLACKNQDTWVFAHEYWGRLMIILSSILTVLSIVGIVLIANDVFTLDPALVVALPALATVIAVIVSIIPTEIALRKEFDKSGERRR
ncbi:MAG: SdpI family protein [Oscillospiraceae bacterium]|nr:SdpI family protein [Oscillospiraceae bacterium]